MTGTQRKSESKITEEDHSEKNIAEGMREARERDQRMGSRGDNFGSRKGPDGSQHLLDRMSPPPAQNAEGCLVFSSHLE